MHAGHRVPPKVDAARTVELTVASGTKGLGADLGLVKRLAAEDPTTASLLDKELQRPAGRPSKETVNNITQFPPTGDNETGNNVPNLGRPEGNAKAKALRKLRKDAPALHAKVLAEEITPHAAMIQAGFLKREGGRKSQI